MRVLVVDDDLTIREILRIILRGHEVIETTDGESAVKLYVEKRPDIVFMDAVLPRMDGITATRKILEIDPNAKIIGITAFSSKGKEMLEAGALALLEKPISKSKVLELMEMVCKERLSHS